MIPRSAPSVYLASALCTVAALSASSTVHADSGGFDGLKKMVTDATANVDLRYRFEGVDQDGVDEDAEASLLRSRLTLTTASWGGFAAQLEFDDITSVGPNDYNSTDNQETEYPVVADPEGTDLNQAWLAYTAADWTAKLGRQRILHGSQRFVGGVAWRQNEQTYDGLRLEVKPLEGLAVDLAYVYNINRIFGPDDGAQPADWEGDNVFFRGQYSFFESHSVAGFAYLIDIDSQGAYGAGQTVNNSTSTFGVEYKGKFFDWLGVNASYATQSDDGDSELDYEADYYMAELSGSFKVITVRAGYEVLEAGEDDNTGLNVGFKTPLATLHKFQGWADKFLGTPADGIEDAYIGVSSKLGPVKLAAVYHDYQAESSSVDYGTEIDLVATWPINKQLSLQAKYAEYEADDLLTDTTKFWLTVQLKL
ncbi:MAG: alginate export family protein [Halioglobus sp.]|nr:alginate export family protein [Halioglobus sp.]